MDHCHTSDLISLEQALEKMLGQIAPLQQTESVALTAAAGRITAAPVVSPLDVPPFANSAMDGYALRLADLAANAPLPVAGKAFAGAPFDGQWPMASQQLRAHHDRRPDPGRGGRGGHAGAGRGERPGRAFYRTG